MREGLSAILMGRDEERFLPLSLPPLRRVADEIVFVDTGSTDRTLEIAGDFGCRILHSPWARDFSTPKNLAIEAAGCAWILNVDCDEVLADDPEWRERILARCRATDRPAWIVTIDNLLADGGSVPSKAIRLFRNDPRIRFVNPVHEGVAESLYRHWPRHPPAEIGVRLIHHGYGAGLNKEKIRRNVAILRDWIDREPDTVYGRYKLGMNLRFLGMASEGLYHLEQAVALAGGDADRTSLPFLEELLAACFQGLLEAGHGERAAALRRTVEGWARGE
ncbi:MAG: glycosyltransferase [Magnetococcales bacterium]|nr:glycosyltransferase [Magnetococcales bacterium]